MIIDNRQHSTDMGTPAVQSQLNSIGGGWNGERSVVAHDIWPGAWWLPGFEVLYGTKIILVCMWCVR